jgi:hypothetical protein
MNTEPGVKDISRKGAKEQRKTDNGRAVALLFSRCSTTNTQGIAIWMLLALGGFAPLREISICTHST